MLRCPADLRAERAARAVCEGRRHGYSGHASCGLHTGSQAGTQAPEAGLQAHVLLTLHACVPRQLKAEPSEAAALAQPRLITRPRQQLGSPTRRSERSRPSSWSGGQRVVARAAWTSCFGVQQCTACFGVHAVASECTGVKSACFGVHRGALENSNGKLKNPDALKIHFSPTVTPAQPDLRITRGARCGTRAGRGRLA